MNVLFRACMLCLTALLLTGCSKQWVWHQKLTLVIETPSGEVTGTSIVRAGWRAPIKRFQELDSGGSSLTGEALAVEVTPGRWLFVLLDGQEDLLWVLLRKPGEGMEQTAPAILAQHEPVQLPPELYPQMVTFGDISDPASVKVVDPTDFAAVFGAGFNLKALTIAVTDQPVTEGKVEGVLGWLQEIWPNHLDGKRYETIESKNHLANSLSANSFSTEIKK